MLTLYVSVLSTCTLSLCNTTCFSLPTATSNVNTTSAQVIRLNSNFSRLMLGCIQILRWSLKCNLNSHFYIVSLKCLRTLYIPIIYLAYLISELYYLIMCLLYIISFVSIAIVISFIMFCSEFMPKLAFLFNYPIRFKLVLRVFRDIRLSLNPFYPPTILRKISELSYMASPFIYLMYFHVSSIYHYFPPTFNYISSSTLGILKISLILASLTLVTILLMRGCIHPNPGPKNNQEITIYHANARSILSLDNNKNPFKFENLKHLAHTLSLDIIGISESWLGPRTVDSQLVIEGYSPPIRNDRPLDANGRSYGGVCVWVKNTIPYSRLSNLETTQECVWLLVKCKNETLIVSFYYRPPRNTIPQTDKFISEIGKSIDSATLINNTGIIILGDFNCKHTDWFQQGGSDNCGEKFNNLIKEKGFTQLIDSPTHFGPYGLSLIDLLVTNIPAKFTLHGSGLPLDPRCDHASIIGQLPTSLNTPSSYTRTMWYYKQINPEEFRDIMSSIPWTVFQDIEQLFNDPNEVYYCWQELFTSAIKDSIPNRTVKIFPGNKPWYRKEHHLIRKKVKRLFKIAVQTKKTLDWNRYKAARNIYKDRCESAKLLYKNRQTSILSSNTAPPKLWWKATKDILGRTSVNFIPPLISNNQVYSTDAEKAEVFATYFSSIFQVEDPNDDVPIMHDDNSEEFLSDIVCTPNDIAKIINRLPPDKAPGPDQITAKMLKLSCEYISESLSNVINISFRSGVLPDILKLSNVCPLFKQGDKHDPKNYRGISLLSLVSKIFERVVFNALYEFLDNKGFFAQYQSGFRKGDSTVYQLIDICNTIYKSYDRKEEVIGIFLDISKAFDKVWHKGLIFKLERAGVRGNLLKWLKSYLTNRKMRVIIEGQESEWKPVEAGVPQGSILGPLLFLIYINDIGENIESDIRLFADDTNLLNVIKNLNESIETINRDLTKITGWAQQWKITMNPTKSKCVLFSNRLYPSRINGITMLGSPIPIVSEVKHLGIILDSKLTWNKHVDHMIKKANKALAPINLLKFQLPSRCLLTYYKAFIRPILEYASSVWGGCSINSTNRLEHVQYTAMLSISGAVKSTSRQNLQLFLGLPSLEDRRKCDHLTILYKIKSNLTPAYLTSTLNDYRPLPRANRRDEFKLTVPMIKLTIASRNFFYRIIRVWNSLPLQIRSKQITPKTFKSILLQHYVASTQSHSVFFLHNNRRLEILFNRFLLNFTTLNADLFRHGIVTDPKCSCQHHSETIDHFLFVCPNYAAPRVQLLLDLGQHIDHLPTTNFRQFLKRLIEIILDTNSIPLAQAIQSFISQTNRFE